MHESETHSPISQRIVCAFNFRVYTVRRKKDNVYDQDTFWERRLQMKGGNKTFIDMKPSTNNCNTVRVSISAQRESSWHRDMSYVGATSSSTCEPHNYRGTFWRRKLLLIFHWRTKNLNGGQWNYRCRLYIDGLDPYKPHSCDLPLFLADAPTVSLCLCTFDWSLTARLAVVPVAVVCRKNRKCGLQRTMEGNTFSVYDKKVS